MAKKQNLKERLRKRREELKNRQSGGNIIYLKPDKEIRVRILNMGEENEFIKEVTQFYLGSDIKGVISPVTVGEPCAINDAYQSLKSSDDDDDRDLAATFPPKQKYLAFVLVYKDLKGKEVDEANSEKFVLLTSGLYQEIIDKYLDEDEWGDMTDPVNGYDLKLKRVGSGKTDTEYSMTPCKNTPTPKAYAKKTYDLDAELKKIIPSYERTEELANQFLGLSNDDDDLPRKSKKSPKKGKPSKNTKAPSKTKKKVKPSKNGDDDLPF